MLPIAFPLSFGAPQCWDQTFCILDLQHSTSVTEINKVLFCSIPFSLSMYHSLALPSLTCFLMLLSHSQVYHHQHQTITRVRATNYLTHYNKNNFKKTKKLPHPDLQCY
ncbi:hypothetical protein AB205_0024780 [Aquarana catesbeiana]|uniref:Uncharacterized protein n=1 Tax=Aquarana catesbeiana TaxID=8400 RepID=A0A2G9RAP7_AQUCT|nr:hypothetical protein AB205_0024780 [Aquarana catesbeiana]